MIWRKEKEELVLFFSGLLELHPHYIFANCFFFISSVYTEVEMYVQLNMYFFSYNYITFANL